MAARRLTVMNLVSEDCRGGADRLALDVSKGLRRRGHRVIWASPSNCSLIPEAREAGIEIFDLYPSGQKDMSVIPSLISYCGKERIDILNTHHSHGRHMAIAARLRGLRTKVVFTRHCIVTTMPLIGTFFHNFFVDMNIAVSNAVRKSILRGGTWPSKAVTIYGGIDPDRLGNVSEEKVADVRAESAAGDIFTIGMVARLGLAKGGRTDKPTMKRHEVLFRALADIKEPFHLLAIGTHKEEDDEKLKVIAQDSGLDLGQITVCRFREEIAPFYRLMDLNVLPSPKEGLPLAIIEPMATGVPCIGADGGGIREIITHGTDGFLFRADDSRDLARYIEILMKDRNLRDSFASKGKEKVKNLFSIEKTVRETEEAFLRLMS